MKNARGTPRRRALPVIVLVFTALTGCVNHPAAHPATRSTPTALVPLVGVWQADFGKGGNHARSLLSIDADGRFRRRDELRLKGSDAVPVTFTGHVDPLGGRAYRFADVTQGGATMAPHPPLTFTLSADGTELSYEAGGDRVTYRRAPTTTRTPR